MTDETDLDNVLAVGDALREMHDEQGRPVPGSVMWDLTLAEDHERRAMLAGFVAELLDGVDAEKVADNYLRLTETVRVLKARSNAQMS